MEQQNDVGWAANSERRLNKSKPLAKLSTEVLRRLLGEQAANFTFLVQLSMMRFMQV
jgi:hypothetical protein